MTYLVVHIVLRAHSRISRFNSLQNLFLAGNFHMEKEGKGNAHVPR